MLPIPPLILRWLRLVEARRALVGGAPERALHVLRDPALALSSRAELLRSRALDVLYRSAADRRAQGRDGSVARLIALMAGEDPERARAARAELCAPPRAAGGEASERMRALLAELRAASAGRALAPGRASRVALAPADPADLAAAGAPASPTDDERLDPSRAGARGDVHRFHLAIDDGGELLALVGTRVTIGHARAARADLPLLADLEPMHAVLALAETFHGGPSWTLGPLETRAVRVNGARLEGAAVALADGDVIELAANARLRFRLPEHASATALLELQRGLESEGVSRVLCFAPGAGGRVRIGPHAERHVPVAGLEHEVSLVADARALAVACSGGVRAAGSAAPAATEIALALPLCARVDLAVHARPSQRVPFGITLRPLDERAPEASAR